MNFPPFSAFKFYNKKLLFNLKKKKIFNIMILVKEDIFKSVGSLCFSFAIFFFCKYISDVKWPNMRISPDLAECLRYQLLELSLTNINPFLHKPIYKVLSDHVVKL